MSDFLQPRTEDVNGISAGLAGDNHVNELHDEPIGRPHRVKFISRGNVDNGIF